MNTVFSEPITKIFNCIYDAYGEENSVVIPAWFFYKDSFVGNLRTITYTKSNTNRKIILNTCVNKYILKVKYF